VNVAVTTTPSCASARGLPGFHHAAARVHVRAIYRVPLYNFFWTTVNAFDVPSDERVLQKPMEPAGTDISASWLALGERTRGCPDVITSRVVRAPRQRLSPSRRENRRSLGARDASPACAGVDAGRACSIQAIEALCRLWTQGSTEIEPGTLSHLRAFADLPNRRAKSFAPNRTERRTRPR
jgi:hypothetical protein